jgi:hypothetical protein
MRLMRQPLTEPILLALVGGAASVIVAQSFPPLLVGAVQEMPMSPQVDLTPNLAISYICVPHLNGCRRGVRTRAGAPCDGARPRSGPKGGGSPVSCGLARSRLRNSLIVAQAAGCTVLLVAAGSLVRGLHRLTPRVQGQLRRMWFWYRLT